MSKYFRLVILISAFFTILLIFNACEKNEKTPLVGVILAITGNQDYIGKPEQAVLEKLIEDQKKNNEIDFIFRDSGCDPGQALTTFNLFAKNSRVIAVIGPSLSGESIPIAQRASIEEIPLLSLAASKQIVLLSDKETTNPWAFKFAQNDDLAAKRLTILMDRLKHTRIALLYSDDGFGKSGAQVFAEAAENLNISIIHQASFPTQLDSPEPYVQAVPKDAHGVMIWGTAPGPYLLVQALKSNDHTGQIYLSHGNASEAFIESCGVASEGAIIVGSRVLTSFINLDKNNPADAVIIRYRSFWQQNFSGAPSHFAGHARDALIALLSIIPNIDLNMEIDIVRENIRNELENLTNFHGVTGTFNFKNDDHAGLGIDSFETYVIENGKFVPYRK